MNVSTGFAVEDIDLIAPAAQQIDELTELGFATAQGDTTWSAVREGDGFRTTLTYARSRAVLKTVRLSDHRVFHDEVHTDLSVAVDRVMELALDVDLVLTLGDVIAAELRRTA